MKNVLIFLFLNITLVSYTMETRVKTISDQPLHQAVERNDIKTINTLLTQGEDANQFDTYGSSPLHYVRSLEAAQILVEHKAEVSLSSQKISGHTPLHNLVQTNTPERRAIASFLLSKNAPINAKNKFGSTPIDLMDWSANPIEMVELLLKNQARIKYCDEGGIGHLDQVIYHGHLDMAKLLLSYKCDPKKISRDSQWFLEGKVPGCDRSEIAALVKEAIAKQEQASS
jgi:ankyrin repeat protein